MPTDSLDTLIPTTEENMKGRLAKLAAEFSVMRTGRASPMILDGVTVEYYGQQVPLKQVARVSVPEARSLEITPWDPSILGDIEKSLQKADLGAMPQNDGKLIRITLPSMTEERRKDMVKMMKKVGEEFRVAIRTERKEAIERIKKAQKAKEIGEDDLKRLEESVQKITDAYVAKVDNEVDKKEKEITTI